LDEIVRCTAGTGRRGVQTSSTVHATSRCSERVILLLLLLLSEVTRRSRRTGETERDDERESPPVEFLDGLVGELVDGVYCSPTVWSFDALPPELPLLSDSST
jgi:hypothetical protein